MPMQCSDLLNGSALSNSIFRELQGVPQSTATLPDGIFKKTPIGEYDFWH